MWVLGIGIKLNMHLSLSAEHVAGCKRCCFDNWGDSSVSMALALQARRREFGPQTPDVDKLGVLVWVWKPRVAHLSPASVVSSRLARDPVSRENQINTKRPPHTHVYMSAHTPEGDSVLNNETKDIWLAFTSSTNS